MDQKGQRLPGRDRWPTMRLTRHQSFEYERVYSGLSHGFELLGTLDAAPSIDLRTIEENFSDQTSSLR